MGRTVRARGKHEIRSTKPETIAEIPKRETSKRRPAGSAVPPFRDFLFLRFRFVSDFVLRWWPSLIE
jgi:hypothetical protein